MVRPTLVVLLELLYRSQREEAFWIGLALLLVGGLVPGGFPVGSVDLAGVLMGCGVLVLSVRVVVGVCSILRTTFESYQRRRTQGRLGD